MTHDPDSPVHHVRELDDPALDDYRNLRDRDLHRADEGLFVGEQALIVERMLAQPACVRSVLVGEPFEARMRSIVPAGVPLMVAPMALMEAIAGFPVHRGVLAIGLRSAVPALDLDAMLARSGPLTLLFCEEITHADNMGQLFRVAAAMGIDGVVLSPGCHDPLYRRCLRVSIGHALGVPWHRSDSWTADLCRVRDLGAVTLVGAATGDDAVILDALERPERVGVLVGTEFAGLSEGAIAACDALVRIPMASGVDSLNVAVAAAICLHRLSRGARS